MQIFKKTTASLLIIGFLIMSVPPKAEAIDAAALGASGATALVGCLNVGGLVSGLVSKLTDKLTSKTSDNVGTKDEEQKKSNQRIACANAVAVALAQATLSQMTESIVNWVNTGFNGNPLYIRNSDSFFKSIENEAITGIKSGLLAQYQNKPDFSPFAKSTLKQLLNDRKAELNKLSSFEYSGPDVKGFTNNFEKGGGWAAWKSITLSERNNPLGVGIKLAENAKTIKDQATKTIKDELSGQGFLSIKKCVDPTDYATKRAAGDTNIVCKRWETVTPGSVIQNQLNQTLGTTTRQLEMSDDVNKVVSKLFTALIDSLIKKGLTSLTKGKATDTYTSGGAGINKSVSGISGFQNGDASDWLKISPGKPIDPRVFDHEVLPDTIINELSYVGDQSTLDQYQNKKINNALIAPSITRRIKQLNQSNPGSGKVNQDANLNRYSEVISDLTMDWCGYALHDLSYCIPGPRPGFEDNNIEGIISGRLNTAHERISQFILAQSGWTDWWKGVDPQVIGNAIQATLHDAYQNSFDIYTQFVQNIYFNNPNVIPVTSVANKELAKWPQYDQQIIDNQNEETDVRSLAYQVFSIQTKMDDLMKRIYQRLNDEAKASLIPGALTPPGSIEAVPIDPACIAGVLPFGGVFGTSVTNVNGTIGSGATTGGYSAGFTIITNGPGATPGPGATTATTTVITTTGSGPTTGTGNQTGNSSGSSGGSGSGGGGGH